MRTRSYLIAIAALMSVAIALQVWRDRGWQAYDPASPVLWLRAGPSTARSLLGYETLVADLYWIRAVVYFGKQGQSKDQAKTYDLLYPFLDLVTTLDPRFTVAYRFGAIFLSEPPPNGPGRPDLAIKILERGVERSPERWEYLHDIGFVNYWHYRDFEAGAKWLERASAIPGSPLWLKATAASMHSAGGDRNSARALWRELGESADNDVMKANAALRLAQFDAMDALDQLDAIVFDFRTRVGRAPQSWRELVAARLLRGLPLDPSGTPFELDPATGAVTVSDRSPLYPMPQGFVASPRR
jgi:hypothetical protein